MVLNIRSHSSTIIFRPSDDSSLRELQRQVLGSQSAVNKSRINFLSTVNKSLGTSLVTIFFIGSNLDLSVLTFDRLKGFFFERISGLSVYSPLATY